MQNTSIVALTVHGPLPCPGTCFFGYTCQPSVSILWHGQGKKKKSHVSGILFSSARQGRSLYPAWLISARG